MSEHAFVKNDKALKRKASVDQEPAVFTHSGV